MLLFFDFDGTLADSLLAAEEVIQELAADYGSPPVSREDMLGWKSMSISEVLAANRLSWLQLPALLVRAKALLGKKLDKIALYPGIIPLIQDLHAAGHTLYILTSNSEKNVRNVLVREGLLDYFKGIYSPLSIFGKAPYIRRLRKKEGKALNECMMIGDEVRDIVSGKEAKVRTLAVSWGFNSPAILAKAQPDYLVEDLCTLPVILAKNMD
jgi:phosphoglycolate phosphatase